MEERKGFPQQLPNVTKFGSRVFGKMQDVNETVNSRENARRHFRFKPSSDPAITMTNLQQCRSCSTQALKTLKLKVWWQAVPLFIYFYINRGDIQGTIFIRYILLIEYIIASAQRRAPPAPDNRAEF
jgi:hypothetical protein